jgi:hypothetical protein
MKNQFDIALFLSPLLKGAYATRQRHIRQAERMHEAIRERWGCATPWSWRDKHLKWFLEHYLQCSAPSTVYYYELTAALIRRRRESVKADSQLHLDKCSPSCVIPQPKWSTSS